MTQQINYQVASLNAIAERFQTISNQAFCHVIRYYTEKGDIATLAKLQQARALAKIIKLTRQYDATYGSTEAAV